MRSHSGATSNKSDLVELVGLVGELEDGSLERESLAFL